MQGHHQQALRNGRRKRLLPTTIIALVAYKKEHKGYNTTFDPKQTLRKLSKTWDNGGLALSILYSLLTREKEMTDDRLQYVVS